MLNQLNSAKPPPPGMLGQIFPFVFVFLHLLVIVYSFSFRCPYFVNKAPLLRAVCKFGYIVCYLAPFFFLPESISVTAFVAVDIFSRFP